ncbi:uncharacterized protein LAESUDRAFT_713478 [Laetiporus sulphureus 93-53]|uniref:F-box domain-containing protein n=1 Tax=Laetiporus sulphureus 93-53 TaxID=1314785 RepID=A0A165EUW9_9APHY|nr:uncharacterized protein LAESUDRAFT_713478 [Laetiporus sulphureus 93-53]KZT07811.1 hypothetical protein LAESUDRAFT_713478 [Laetiporus sulphureus 93-53]
MKELAASLETIHFAFWEPPISIKSIAALRIGPLLRAAGASLRDLSLSFYGVDLDAAEASRLIASNVDISMNTKLENLQIGIQIGGRVEDGAAVQGCTWMSSLLTNVSPLSLRKLTLLIDIRWRWKGVQAALCNIVLAYLSTDECTRIDGLLSDKKFEKLEEVKIQLYGTAGTLTLDEKWWNTTIPPLFPKLCAQNILR